MILKRGRKRILRNYNCHYYHFNISLHFIYYLFVYLFEKRRYGENRPPEKPQRGYFHFVWDALQDKTLIILAVCAAVSIVLGVTVEEDKR